jgi:hypothetical protein
MANMNPPVKSAAFDWYTRSMKTDGTVLLLPQGLTSRLLRDGTGAAGPTPTIAASAAGSGILKVAMTATGMAFDCVVIAINSTTSGFFSPSITIYTGDKTGTTLAANAVNATTMTDSAADRVWLAATRTLTAVGATVNANVVQWKGTTAPANTGDAYVTASAVHAHVDTLFNGTGAISVQSINALNATGHAVSFVSTEGMSSGLNTVGACGGYLGARRGGRGVVGVDDGQHHRLHKRRDGKDGL